MKLGLAVVAFITIGVITAAQTGGAGVIRVDSATVGWVQTSLAGKAST